MDFIWRELLLKWRKNNKNCYSQTPDLQKWETHQANGKAWCYTPRGRPWHSGSQYFFAVANMICKFKAVMDTMVMRWGSLWDWGNAGAFLVLGVDTLDTRAQHTTHTRIGLYPVLYIDIHWIHRLKICLYPILLILIYNTPITGVYWQWRRPVVLQSTAIWYRYYHKY